MNGRIYDPTLGRFLQADPHIQAPKNSQNYNRYSYVLNNPLSYTDPSGYFFKKLKKFAMKVTGSWYVHKFLNRTGLSGIVSVALNFIPGCQAWCSAAFNADATFVATGSLKASIKAGAISYATAIAHGAVGEAFAAGTVENVLGNALVGGISADLQGGNFGHAFIAAGISSGFKGKNSDYGVGTAANLKPLRVAIAAVIGGTASRITGGKFANGAITSAFAQLYNGEKNVAQSRYEDQIKALAEAYKKSGLEFSQDDAKLALRTALQSDKRRRAIVSNAESLDEAQMQLALETAISMSYTGEEIELIGESPLALIKGHKWAIKNAGGHTFDLGDVRENLNDSFTSFGFGISTRVGGTLYLRRPTQPYGQSKFDKYFNQGY